MAAALWRLLQVLSVLAVVVSGAESALVVVGGETGWTTGFDYDAWAAALNLQIKVGDSLVFVNPNPSYHTVSLLETADAFQRCTLGGGGTVYPIPAGGNYTMIVPASLESRTLYAVCTVAGHCSGGQKIKALVAPGTTAAAAPAPARAPASTPIVSNPNDADLNRYICWTTAIVLIAACFWNFS